MINEFRPYKKLYVKWVDDEIGWGVFADEPILSGETVEVCYCLLDNVSRSPHMDYVFPATPGEYNDVYHVLGYGAIYNHSNEPNISWGVIDRQRNVIEFRATKDIKTDEELRWNYGKGYWKNRKKKKLL